MVDPVQIAAFGTLISATTLILALGRWWWDSRSHVKIDYYLGADPPREWRADASVRRTAALSEPALWFRVENVGRRNEALSDAYIEIPAGGLVYPYPRKALRLPRPVQPGFPLVFGERLDIVAEALGNEGYTGTARLDFVVRLGRGKRHKKRIEIPDVEARAKGREPDQNR